MRIFGLGPTELMIILAILLLLFGPKQIPKLARMFGKGMRELREGVEGKLDSADEGDGVEVPGKAEAEAKVDSKVEEGSKTPSS